MIRWILGALMLVSASASITDCGPGRWPIEMLGFYPDPPTAGEDTAEIVIFHVPEGETVSAGTAVYNYNINGIPFTPTENDLCQDLECPVEGRSDAYNKTSVSPWPQISGKVEVKMEWFDDVGELLLCTNIVTRVAEAKAVWRPLNWFKDNYGSA